LTRDKRNNNRGQPLTLDISLFFLIALNNNSDIALVCPMSRADPHLLLCHPSVAGMLRCPRHSEAIGAREPDDDDDIPALRPGTDDQRAEKPAGSVTKKQAEG
jgi:hypothetical protein